MRRHLQKPIYMYVCMYHIKHRQLLESEAALFIHSIWLKSYQTRLNVGQMHECLLPSQLDKQSYRIPHIYLWCPQTCWRLSVHSVR